MASDGFCGIHKSLCGYLGDALMPALHQFMRFVVRSSCGGIFHVVSIVEMRGRDDYHTFQRIESHPDRGTSAWQRLTS